MRHKVLAIFLQISLHSWKCSTKIKLLEI